MQQFAAVLCLLLWVFSILSSSASAEVIQKPEFSLTLPEGWVEIPKETLELMTATAQAKVPSIQLAPYECGFQLASGKSGLSPPYILVQWTGKGKRLSEKQLRSMQKIDIKKTVKDSGIDSESIVPNAALGQMKYDEASNTLWMDMEAGSEAVGMGRSVMAGFPTEKGLLQVTGHFMSADADADLPAFHQIVQSIVISPEIAYRTHWSDDLQGGYQNQFGPKQALLWLGSLIGLLVVIRWRQRAMSGTNTTLK